jgi:hypothetical protein
MVLYCFISTPKIELHPQTPLLQGAWGCSKMVNTSNVMACAIKWGEACSKPSDEIGLLVAGFKQQQPSWCFILFHIILLQMGISDIYHRISLTESKEGESKIGSWFLNLTQKDKL